MTEQANSPLLGEPSAPLRVVLIADLVSGGISGGIEQFAGRLIHALGSLDDGDEEYIVVTGPRDPDWIRPYLGSNQRIAVRPWTSWRERLASRVPISEAMLTRIREFKLRLQGGMAHAPAADIRPDPFLASLGADVVHFLYQKFAAVGAATIFNPHDLLHVHYPQYFTPEVYALRETLYRAWCERATCVSVPSRSVKHDLIEHYGLPPDKVQIVPYGSVIPETGAIDGDYLKEVHRRLSLPERFVFYPAQTWPHKNHIRLIEALALLRDRDGERIDLVCTGMQNEHWPAIRQRIHELSMQGQVRFLGYVSARDLRSLYRLAQFVIIPSLFEGAGIPVLEAFAENTPVACSNRMSLPAMAGRAALLFDPLDIQSIADAIRKMATDERLRRELVQKAAERLEFFTWERTARTYRALYRKVAGHPLSDEDEGLLAAGEQWPD